jgi:putative ABC transport system permease protein
VIKNALRHKLRAFLTAVGMAIAIVAFSLLRTIIDAYFIGVEASSDSRLVTRNNVSLTFPLPYAYKEKIAGVEGVTNVAVMQWFGGVYIDQRNFFAKFAIEPEPYLEMYPEFQLTPEARENFLRERSACIVGRKLADKYGWEVGDNFRIVGDIYPGDWDFTIRGIYEGRDKTTDETAMFFHWKYIDERMVQEAPGRASMIGTFALSIENDDQANEIAETIDAMFKNSSYETKTETEKEFNLSFVSMVGTIITAVRVISIVVIAIILLVLANTMAMNARERLREYAVMKTLGFKPKHIAGLIFGESAFISSLGWLLGMFLAIPIIQGFAIYLTSTLGGFFPVFELTTSTLIMTVISAALVSLVSALFPTVHAIKMRISEGLRKIG